MASQLRQHGSTVVVLAGDLLDPSFPERVVQEAVKYVSALSY